MEILGYLYVVAAVLLLFGAAVFVHEWGHYIVARKRGLKVEAFAIGFGPKLFSWTRDGIEYSWRAIPAGGYVKLPQMITSETLEGQHDKAEPIPPASPFSKILVALAGPVMNVIFGLALATILYFVGLPVLVNPSIIGRVDPGSPEGRLGIRDGDRVVEVNGKPVKSWQDITFQVATARASTIPVVIEREGKRTTYQLEAKTSESVGLKWLNLEPREHPVVGTVQDGMPAAQVGLKSGDKFITFNGVPVHDQAHLIDLVSKSEGKPSEVVVERQGEKLTFTVTPKYDPKEKRGRIGIAFGGGLYELQKPGPLPWENVIGVIDKTVATLGALIYSKQTGVKASDLSGPVGILGMLAIQVKTDWRLALNFMVLLNINLAVLNLLPIPVLDGGHILMAIIERIRRKPISAKFVEYSTTAFAVLLISFMLYVTFFDIKRVPLFKSLLQRDTQVEKNEKPATPPAPAPAPAK
ncbi:MAG TPA: RIP metalloprotease RseP [Verrucomicrobiae bacterium]|jgi:regulator of sigma E protease